MQNYNEILNHHLAEQIAIEEHLSAKIEQALGEIREESFVDVKDLLSNIREVLGANYTLLNKAMDKLYEDPEPVEQKAPNGTLTNGKLHEQEKSLERKKGKISKMLREIYSDLSMIAVANTQLHTVGLAYNNDDVAELALRQLENLAALVVKVGEIVPEILTRELMIDEPEIDLAIAQKALANTRMIWKF